jgi:hypothetical protein
MIVSSFYFHLFQKQGQSESKKLAKRAAAAANTTTGAETKGTSISFGFNKKKTGANKKHTDSYNATAKEKEKEKANKFADDGKYFAAKPATVITNPSVYQQNVIKDDNGNTGEWRVPGAFCQFGTMGVSESTQFLLSTYELSTYVAGGFWMKFEAQLAQPC